MPGILDHIVVIAIAVLFPLHAFYAFPRLKRAVACGQPRARVRAYRATMIRQWTATAAVLAIWLTVGRPLADLGLGVPGGWGFWLGVGLLGLALAAFAGQLRIARRSAEAREHLREQLKPIAALLPQTRAEMSTFTLLAITAGVCEELLFRGLLIWYLSHFAGLALAVAGSTLFFGLGHAYQGRAGALKAGAVGLICAGLYLLSGSLWPAMLLHAALDINGGLLARIAAQTKPPPETTQIAARDAS